MNGGIERKDRPGILGEEDRFRAKGLDSSANYIAHIGNRFNVSLSEGTLKEHICAVLGLPKGTLIPKFIELIPVDHPYRDHFGITENGQKFYFDRFLLLLALEKLVQTRANHPQSTIQMNNKKIRTYISELRTELNLPPQEQA